MIAGNRTGWALSSRINAPCPKTPTAVQSPATGLTLPCPPGHFPHSTEPPAPARLPSLQPTESTGCWNCKSCARNQQVVINCSHWSRQKARSLSSACSWVSRTGWSPATWAVQVARCSALPEGLADGSSRVLTLQGHCGTENFHIRLGRKGRDVPRTRASWRHQQDRAHTLPNSSN